jgi:hypothetical protein
VYPTIKINSHTADEETGKIEVYVVDGQNKELIWSKGRGDTDKGHKEIV